MASSVTYSMIRRMVSGGGLHWKHLKPQLLQHRHSEIFRRYVSASCVLLTKPLPKSSPMTSHRELGPEGQNPPEKFDGGDYDEEKNQEYEDEAERQAKMYRRIKKVASTTMFVSVLAYVGYARRKKRQEVASYMKDVKLIKDDGLFQGSEILCVYEKRKMGDGGAKVVLPLSLISDGTISSIHSFDLSDGDIIVASFPKAGTTWVQEIVYLISNNLDFAEAKKQVLETRFPYFEYPYPGLNSIEKMKSPRLIKTHLPYDYLPNTSDKARIIYVTRNPKDLVVSYYHFARMFTMFNFVGTFDEFLEKFKNDEVPYSPFFDHVEGYLKHKDQANLLIVTYEELHKHPEEVIKKIAGFLGKTLMDEQVQKLVEHTRFENMAANPSVNYEHWDYIGFRNKKESKFMRKGIVGDWRNYLNPEDNKKFDIWIKQKNTAKFPFVYE